jgi:hypothetical protein
MALTAGTYTPAPKGQFHQDASIDPVTLSAGTLAQRFDVKAYPKLGHTLTGTDGNGYDVPAPARATTGANS